MMGLTKHTGLGALLLCLLAGCAQSPQHHGADRAQITGEALNGKLLTKYRVALTHATEGEHDKAQDILEALSERQPRHPGVWLNLASVYYQKGRPERASEALAKAQALEPDNPAAYNLKGVLALENGDTKNAETLYHKALEQDDTLADAHYNLALLYDTYYQDIATAIKHYQAYLALHPDEDKVTEQWVQQLQRSLEN